jgi:hypothetical protein
MLEILSNPRQRLQAAQKFEPLIDQLIDLLKEGKDVVGPLEFLDLVKGNKRLDENQKLKLSLIQSLSRRTA